MKIFFQQISEGDHSVGEMFSLKARAKFEPQTHGGKGKEWRYHSRSQKQGCTDRLTCQLAVLHPKLFSGLHTGTHIHTHTLTGKDTDSMKTRCQYEYHHLRQWQKRKSSVWAPVFSCRNRAISVGCYKGKWGKNNFHMSRTHQFQVFYMVTSLTHSDISVCLWVPTHSRDSPWMSTALSSMITETTLLISIYVSWMTQICWVSFKEGAR